MGKKLIDALDAMGMGVLATLIVGTILRQIATLMGESGDLLFTVGSYAQVLMAVGVGIGVATSLGAKPVVIYATVVTSMMGAGTLCFVDGSLALSIGDPAGAFITALATVLLGNLIAGKTKIDVLLVPGVCLVFGALVAVTVAPVVTQLTGWIGTVINTATTMHPLFMGMIVATIFCFILLSPLSSSALAIGLGLSGIAAGAALAGTASCMVGFAIVSYKDNGIGGFISQGIGTAKIQFGNFIKNPAIFIPAFTAALVTGPLSTVVFQMETNSLGAGMGTSGLVGQIQTLYVMGSGALWLIVLVQVAIPALVSFVVWKYLRKKRLIKDGDMTLPIG